MDFRLVTAIRQNHALEHATITLLASARGPRTVLAGRAGADGFYLYGDVPTEAVADAAGEALARLQKGEVDLAVSPFCGTSLATAGVLAGLGAVIAVGSKNRLQRLPQALTAAFFGVLIAQPLGRLVQKHFTTSADLANLRIEGITRAGWGRWTVHKVKTALI